MGKINELERKHVKRNKTPNSEKKLLGQNLQPDVKKLQSTIKKIQNRMNSNAQLRRLRRVTVQLLETIDTSVDQESVN